MSSERKNHWETVYETKQPDQVSWTQEKPETSLNFIRSFGIPKTASIIDIGGGDSNLVDFLLKEGYQNISVLDISEQALERAKKRLGEKGNKVKWIVSDITEFNPSEKYDVWHDRATFHFLTNPGQINRYLEIVKHAVSGFMVVATFSEKGPDKCSGLEISKYSADQLTETFKTSFEKIKCLNEDHSTPFKTIQNFTNCSFKRKAGQAN